MEVITKFCTKCQEVKPIDGFHKDKNAKDGVVFWCKECVKIYQSQYQKDNAEIISKKAKESRDNNKERLIEWRKLHSDRRQETTKLWKINNKEMENATRRKRYSKQKQDPAFQLANNVRGSIRKALKRNKNWQHWEYLLGYTKEDLQQHLEKQFVVGMSWENYGQFGWHVDHIIPRSLWYFETYIDREFKQCWALCNLQPLWAFDNLSKGNKIA